MKKFQFSLQKLMDFREQELDRQKNTLSALRVELQNIEEAAEALRVREPKKAQSLSENAHKAHRLMRYPSESVI